MHLIFRLVRFYPYWAVPLGFIIFELGVFFRRKRKKQYLYCWGVVGFLGLLLLLWLIFRGDVNSDRWVRSMIGT